MADEGFKRKLTVIFSADVVGYSRLMEDNEEATVRTLTSYREVIFTLIKQHNGIVVDSPGDNLLAEFVSVVDAVQCAVSIQNEINTRNEDLPENRKMQFRIGINLGDVIQEGERIYGDGVNIAARLEALADPGGICISKTAFDQIERKLPYGYEFIGDQTVKNISKPVGAYRVMLEPRVTKAGEPEKEKPVVSRRKPILAGVAVVLILAVAVGIWQFYIRRATEEPASIEKMAFPLPEKPSIAVLPFVNLSDSPDQEYFSDGLTEEIITGLSKVPELFVIASNSSFTYKGKPVKVQRVSEELGVRYVLEGSVRKEGNRVRITAQLIDAIKGHHIWSERYDREFKDLLTLQEDIMRNIILEMRVKLTEGEEARIWNSIEKQKKIDIKAFEKSMQGRWHFLKFTPEDNAISRQLAEESIEIDPNPGAYVGLAWTHLMDISFGSSESPSKSLTLAEEFAQKALQLDDSFPWTRTTLAEIYVRRGQLDKAVAEAKKALDLDPNGAHIKSNMGWYLLIAGRPEEAIPFLEKAIRLNPYPSSMYYWKLGAAYADLERHDEAIDAYKKAIIRQPNDVWAHLFLMISYCRKGLMEDARAEASEVLRINPQCTISVLVRTWHVADEETLNNTVECFRMAGIPER